MWNILIAIALYNHAVSLFQSRRRRCFPPRTPFVKSAFLFGSSGYLHPLHVDLYHRRRKRRTRPFPRRGGTPAVLVDNGHFLVRKTTGQSARWLRAKRSSKYVSPPPAERRSIPASLRRTDIHLAGVGIGFSLTRNRAITVTMPVFLLDFTPALTSQRSRRIHRKAGHSTFAAAGSEQVSAALSASVLFGSMESFRADRRDAQPGKSSRKVSETVRLTGTTRDARRPGKLRVSATTVSILKDRL